VNVTIDLSNVPNELPSQTGQAGKALVTNGSSVSWASAGTSLPTDGSTSVAYTTTNTTAGRTYGFKLESNTCGIAEVPYITTSDDTGARGVHVGYKHEQAAYGGGSVSVGYEALLPGFGVTTTTANAERTVAIGYQAGYNAHATTSSIFIGPYQGYAVSAARQLRIGNSGTPHPNSGYDKALLEGTFGTTDATQTFKINADAVYLGLAIPTTQPSDTRLWLNNGSLSIGAAGGAAPTAPKIDARSLSNNNVTLQNADGTTSSISANGVLWGSARVYNYILDNTLVKARGFSAPDPVLLAYHNGVRGGNDLYDDTWYLGGHVIYQFVQSYQVRYNAWYFYRYYDTTPDLTLGIYASNDRAQWTELTTFNLNSSSAYSNGATSSTQTLGGVSITFPGRTTSDTGVSGSPSGGVRRYTFANSNYYTYYMIKNIANSVTITGTTSPTGISINTQMEFEWG
jgi:hypothetical protein